MHLGEEFAQPVLKPGQTIGRNRFWVFTIDNSCAACANPHTARTSP